MAAAGRGADSTFTETARPRTRSRATATRAPGPPERIALRPRTIPATATTARLPRQRKLQPYELRRREQQRQLLSRNSASNGYASRSGSTSGNAYSGNYSHSGSGSNPYGSYHTSGSGNTYNHTYNGSATATNAWGQTYHASTYANNGVVYHGAVVTNPVYHGYATWGWNDGYAWYAAPAYWGGGFWGPFAIGVTSAAVYGSIVAANNATITSYQVQPDSPGAKFSKLPFDAD